MNIEANTGSELKEKLADTDISVPARTSGRTNDHVERWVIYRALATLLADGQIEYPVRLMKRERPDYLLIMGNREIGCEVTEAINSEYLKAKSLPEAAAETSVVDVSLFKWSAPKRKLEKLREIASREKLTGAVWAGNSVEREYADIVFDVAKNKTKKMAKVGYQTYQENYLLIYLNQSLPILNQKESATICADRLAGYWSAESFDSIFVEKAEHIAVYSSSGFKILPLNDIWKNG